MVEKELATFRGDGRFGWVPFLLSLVLVGVASDAMKEQVALVFLSLLFLFYTWKDLGPLVRAGSQRVAVTNIRVRGEVNYGLVSGSPKVTFSIPYSEILETERSLSGYGLKIKVAGRSKKLQIIGLRNAAVLENFLANIVAIRTQGVKYEAVPARSPWGNNYNDLMLAIHETADMVAGEVPPEGEPFEPLDLSPREARVDVTGVWVKWLGASVVVLAVLAGAVLFGAYVVAVADAQQRLGGSTVCVTAARAYRDALPRAVNISLEKLDNDPSNALSRALISQVAGRLLADAYKDNAFVAESELQCGLQLAANYYNDGFIATQISDEIESELRNLVN